MLYFLEQINFLEDFTFTEVVLHVVLFYGFDGHLFASEFVHSESDLSKCSFADKLDKLIEIKGSWW